MIRHGWQIASLFVVLFVTAGCGKAHQGWDAFPVKLYADSKVLSQGSSDLQDAMDFWEEKAGRKLFDFQGLWTGASPYTGDVHNPSAITSNVIFFPQAWPFAQNAVGMTTVSETTNFQIQSAMIMINPSTRFCTSDCRNTFGMTSQRKTLTHELGHFLGLDHVNDVNNIMYPDATPGGSLEGLEVDMDSLQQLTGSR